MGERLAQEVAVLSVIDPQGVTASSTVTGDVIDAKLYDKLMFIFMAGAVTSSGKYTLTVYKGTASSTVTTSVTTATIAFAADNTQKIIDIDLGKTKDYRYFKPTIVANGGTASGGSYYCLVALGSSTRYHPASDNDLSSVSSITYV